MDDKAEAFAEWLLGDMFGCLTDAARLKIEYSNQREGERRVPEDFYREIVVFGTTIVEELMDDINEMPVLLCSSEDFFRRFTKSVCLKLIKTDDPELDFLKVMVFLMLIITMSFVNGCYRFIEDLPTILRKLLKEHIKTKFYEEDRFDAISSLCRKLEQDKEWYKSTVEEMRSYMNDAKETELAATKIPHHPLEHNHFRTKITILETRPPESSSESSSESNSESSSESNSESSSESNSESRSKSYSDCPFCGMPCILSLKAFWKPKIMYKPESECKPS